MGIYDKLAKTVFNQIGNALVLKKYKYIWEIIKTYHLDKRFLDIVEEYLKDIDNFAEYRKKLTEICKHYHKNDLNYLVCKMYIEVNPTILKDNINYGIWGIDYNTDYLEEYYFRYKYAKDGSYF